MGPEMNDIFFIILNSFLFFEKAFSADVAKNTNASLVKELNFSSTKKARNSHWSHRKALSGSSDMESPAQSTTQSRRC